MSEDDVKLLEQFEQFLKSSQIPLPEIESAFGLNPGGMGATDAAGGMQQQPQQHHQQGHPGQHPGQHGTSGPQGQGPGGTMDTRVSPITDLLTQPGVGRPGMPQGGFQPGMGGPNPGMPGYQSQQQQQSGMSHQQQQQQQQQQHQQQMGMPGQNMMMGGPQGQGPRYPTPTNIPHMGQGNYGMPPQQGQQQHAMGQGIGGPGGAMQGPGMYPSRQRQLRAALMLKQNKKHQMMQPQQPQQQQQVSLVVVVIL